MQVSITPYVYVDRGTEPRVTHPHRWTNGDGVDMAAIGVGDLTFVGETPEQVAAFLRATADLVEAADWTANDRRAPQAVA